MTTTTEGDILQQVGSIDALSRSLAKALFQLADPTRPIERVESERIRQELFDWTQSLQRVAQAVEVRRLFLFSTLNRDLGKCPSFHAMEGGSFYGSS